MAVKGVNSKKQRHVWKHRKKEARNGKTECNGKTL